MAEFFEIKGEGTIPCVAAAIHNGHLVRTELFDLFALSEAERLREEDPFTGDWTIHAGMQIVGHRSRFEVDLNRPRDKAVYINPEDAWGLKVWKERPSEEIIAGSLGGYDNFYDKIGETFKKLEQKFGRFIVYDLHTYNHRRAGSDGAFADPEGNPEVNIGTGTMERGQWAPVVDRFIKDLHDFDFLGRQLDVRENVKFRGGEFSRWIHRTFPDSACSMAIEFKKFFMDEWTGVPNRKELEAISSAIRSTLPGVLEELKKL